MFFKSERERECLQFISFKWFEARCQVVCYETWISSSCDWTEGQVKSSSSMLNVDQQRSCHLIKLLSFEFSGLHPKAFLCGKNLCKCDISWRSLTYRWQDLFYACKGNPISCSQSIQWLLNLAQAWLIVEYFYWLLIKKTLYCVLSKQSYYFPSFLDPLLL